MQDSTHRRGTDYCFTGLPVISLGVHRKVYSGRCLHVLPGRGVPLSAGIRDGNTTSWRCGMAAGTRCARFTGRVAAVRRRPSPSGTRAGGPRWHRGSAVP